MPRYIFKIEDEKFNKDYYLEWSTVVDAPVTRGMNKEEFYQYYLKTYGTGKSSELASRLLRTEKQGSSCRDDLEGTQHYFEYNRAGENESSLDKEGILDRYCR